MNAVLHSLLSSRRARLFDGSASGGTFPPLALHAVKAAQGILDVTTPIEGHYFGPELQQPEAEVLMERLLAEGSSSFATMTRLKPPSRICGTSLRAVAPHGADVCCSSDVRMGSTWPWSRSVTSSCKRRRQAHTESSPRKDQEANRVSSTRGVCTGAYTATAPTSATRVCASTRTRARVAATSSSTRWRTLSSPLLRRAMSSIRVTSRSTHVRRVCMLARTQGSARVDRALMACAAKIILGEERVDVPAATSTMSRQALMS